MINRTFRVVGVMIGNENKQDIQTQKTKESR